ncbi:hypothetical protein POM88_018668 [Heracleum sosnowskyi]|uniref:Glutaredoxin domain-containing protein n=1 Tax=Heracleum sosnowskyi TaxID=360622 RepID=A0AAD8IUU9_9APIA|nr:hypothetical protein POM88_018668 [Heracleum sosnowskyi]
MQSPIFSLEDVESVIAVRQETKIQSWPSARRAVVYLRTEIVNSQTCQSVREILTSSGLTVEERDVMLNSNFTSMFLKSFRVGLTVEDLMLPIVFFDGRYIGGASEIRALKETGQLKSLVFGLPEVKDGTCRDCGGYKFILFDGKDLIKCTACDGTGLESDSSSINYNSSLFSSGGIKLYICLEAEDSQQRHVYMICSIEGGWLATQQTSPPTINTEAVIYGYPSMGFGVYESRIILAGGELPSDLHRRHNDCITFDMTNNSISYEPFMLMNEGKYKPLVFQLDKWLYVCDSEYHIDKMNNSYNLSVESISPCQTMCWCPITSSLFRRPLTSNDSLVNYSCLVFGNNCLMSVPYKDGARISNPSYLNHMWKFYSNASLPFTGVATFYSQDDFEDFVMIYINNGVVRVCQFNFFCFEDSQDLFTVDSHTGGGEMHGYFVDYGKGCFCLTAYDKSYIYIYTFAITREGMQSGPLKVTHRILSWYVFSIDRFRTEGRRIATIVGCFSPARNEEANSHVEKVAATYFKDLKINENSDPRKQSVSEDWYVTHNCLFVTIQNFCPLSILWHHEKPSIWHYKYCRFLKIRCIMILQKLRKQKTGWKVDQRTGADITATGYSLLAFQIPSFFSPKALGARCLNHSIG